MSLQSGAAEECLAANFVVVDTKIPGARFLPVSCAIGEASVPSIIIFCIGGGVLYIFTGYSEITNRYTQVYAVEFVAFKSVVIVFKLQVVCSKFSESEVIASLCIESILIINRSKLNIARFSIRCIKLFWQQSGGSVCLT